jgi:hypothetical protein
MKKTIIIILAMLFFIAIPAFASTPENENAPVPTSEDQQFMGLTQLTEEELLDIIGNVITGSDSCPDGAETLGPQPNTQWYERQMSDAELKKQQSLIYKLTHKFKIPAAVAYMLLASVIKAIDLANAAGNYALPDIIEYAVIGIAIADPAFLSAIGTAAIVGLITYTISVLFE